MKYDNQKPSIGIVTPKLGNIVIHYKALSAPALGAGVAVRPCGDACAFWQGRTLCDSLRLFSLLSKAYRMN